MPQILSAGLGEKFDKLPQVMSLESPSVGAKDGKFENEKDLVVWTKKEISPTYLSSPSSSLLEARLAATSLTHQNLQANYVTGSQLLV